MSSQKLKYFVVTSTSVVAAKNQSDAIAVSRGRRGVTGKVLDSNFDIERITAKEAKNEEFMTA